ncbi:MAG: hypothetical protein ABWK00_05805 [Desulfurococcaceae archaeon]
MSKAALSTENLKSELLKLLREDEEFRLAVAGLIGLGEVLGELRRLREDFQAFMREQERRWEENNRRWEENNRRWEEAYKRFEAIEEELRKLREDFLAFVKEQEKRWEEANRRFSRIETELGALTESTYCRYVLEDLMAEARALGDAVKGWKRNASIGGVDVDLFIETQERAYVVEVKVKPSIEDVDALKAKAEIVASQLRKTVMPVLAGALVGREVEAYAEGKGVRVFKY